MSQHETLLGTAGEDRIALTKEEQRYIRRRS